MKRNKRLSADPDRVREFMQRGRKPLERTELRRKVRARPAEGPLSPREWQLAVFKASEGRCIISGARARDVDDPRFHAHHPLAKRTLRERGYYGRVWDPRNGIWLRADLHMQHEYAPHFWIAYEQLPPAVWAFCAELDELEGTEWATLLVTRAHPTNPQEVADGAGRARDRPEG